jgi:chitinase
MERGVSPGRAAGSAVAGGLTYAICASAIAGLVAAAPFTFGLSLLGIPAETALCIAAGIAVTSIGFAAGSGGKPSQPNPVSSRT